MLRTREDLAWAAGFFEGEGWFSFWMANNRRTPYLAAGVNNTDYSMLSRFKQIVGFGNLPDRPKTGRNYPIWEWKANGFEKTQALAVMLWPWLSDKRKIQYKYALWRYIPVPSTEALIASILLEEEHEG